MSKKVVKEITLAILIVLIILVALAILFYDSFTATDSSIQSVSYEKSEGLKSALDDIENKSGTKVEEAPAVEEPTVVEPEVEETTTFDNGKKDPFASNASKEEAVSTTVVQEEKNITVDDILNATSSQNESTKENNSVVKGSVSNTVTTPKNETSTGSYFEKPNSK